MKNEETVRHQRQNFFSSFFIHHSSFAVCLALAAITLLVYSPMLWHGFINYDDPDYITGNAHVIGGLTWTNVAWAFTTGDAANWHPLTWISHMTDCQLFGLNPAGHHLTNLLFHIANTLLLFLLLKKLTSAIWRSFFVAALFAWHPLHVESVAWASERKDVLSAFFWMLALLAYAQFAGLSKIQNPKSKAFYILALFLFACGLMSKPMVVTLPFVLLLLDFWPLQRFTIYDLRFTIWRLISEKIPFFALSAAASVVTFLVQKAGGATLAFGVLPLHARIENALLGYVRYLSKIFWPGDLALIYPYPAHFSIAAVVGAAALLVLLTAIFILQTKQFPYLLVGWLWFLGTLVPVIGVVQVGFQSIADRYTYLPSIGIFILAAWSMNDFLNSRANKKKISALAGTAALAGCLAATSIQLKYWRGDVELFWHTIKVTNDNYDAYDCFGRMLENIGKKKEAVEFYKAAISINPNYSRAHVDVAMDLLDLNGDPNEISNHLAAAARLSPGSPVMQYDFGVFLAQHGQPGEAAAHFKAALADKPDFSEAQKQLDLLSSKTNSPARSTR
ncbi:MAG TPA: tetratricopeptide repeat protein [Verrucomicrobiae bacterium]|jgi:tetratricopeptide (TPR) repeat protein